MTLNTNTYTEWGIHLRSLATVFMVMLHVAASAIYQHPIESSTWCIANFYDSLSRFCVPIFIMLSGTFMLNKNYTLDSTFIKTKIMRLFYPFLVWSLFYALLNLKATIYDGKPLNAIESIQFILYQLYQGSSFHLWYMYLIFFLYLTLPTLSQLLRTSPEKRYLLFFIFWFLSIFICQFIWSPFAYFPGYLGYLVLGYYLSKSSLRGKKAAISLYLIGCCITFIGTYVASTQQGHFSELFYNFLTLNVLISSIGLYVFVKNIHIKNPVLIYISKAIAANSFGIYLCHVIILRLFVKIGIDYHFIHPLVGIPLTSVLAIAASWLLVFCLQKLPFGNYLVG